MQYVSSRQTLLFILLSVYMFTVNGDAVARGQIEWRVESDSKNLEVLPAYAGEKTPFKVKEKPKEVKKRVVKVEKPQELTPEQVKALRAADVLNEIRGVLNKEEVFNADLTAIAIDAIMSIEGVNSALIKNRWYEEGTNIDVPVAAKENLLQLVEKLKELDESLAEVVDAQVKEKIELVKNLSLTIEKITDDHVSFIDEQGSKHVINFKRQSF